MVFINEYSHKHSIVHIQIYKTKHTCMSDSSRSFLTDSSGSLSLSSGKYCKSEGSWSFSSEVKVSGPARGYNNLAARSISSLNSQSW